MRWLSPLSADLGLRNDSTGQTARSGRISRDSALTDRLPEPHAQQITPNAPWRYWMLSSYWSSACPARTWKGALPRRVDGEDVGLDGDKPRNPRWLTPIQLLRRSSTSSFRAHCGNNMSLGWSTSTLRPRLMPPSTLLPYSTAGVVENFIRVTGAHERHGAHGKDELQDNGDKKHWVGLHARRGAAVVGSFLAVVEDDRVWLTVRLARLYYSWRGVFARLWAVWMVLAAWTTSDRFVCVFGEGLASSCFKPFDLDPWNAVHNKLCSF